MKKIFVITALFFTVCANAQNVKQLTKEDYDAAANMLAKNLYKHVERMNVNAHWLPSGKFWYENRSDNGVEYVIVNPVTGSKKTSAKKDEETLGFCIMFHKRYTKN